MTNRPASLGVPLAAGATTAVLLGLYGAVHDPTGRSFVVAGFDDVDTWKNALATVTLGLFAVQVALGLRLVGRFGPPTPPQPWLGDVHRIVGTLGFAASLPVAFHCLWSLGYRSSDVGVLIHSLAGCTAYGIYAAKVVAVRRGDGPAWVVPVAGMSLGVTVLTLWWGTALVHYTS